MPVAKRAAKGTVLQLSISTVFTTVGQCKKIDYPSNETQFVDGTGLDSTDVEDGIPNGLSAPGSVAADLFFDALDTVHQRLISQHAAKSIESWKIANPNIGVTTTHACTFSGAIKTFKPTANVGGLVEAALEIKLSAPPTYNVAAV